MFDTAIRSALSKASKSKKKGKGFGFNFSFGGSSVSNSSSSPNSEQKKKSKIPPQPQPPDMPPPTDHAPWLNIESARIGEDWKKLVNNEHLHDLRFDFIKYENQDSLGGQTGVSRIYSRHYITEYTQIRFC